MWNATLNGNLSTPVTAYSDSQHFDWFFYVYNASRMTAAHDARIKLAGPLCDGGDYFHMGVKGEEFYCRRRLMLAILSRFLTPGHTPLKVKPFITTVRARGGDDR